MIKTRRKRTQPLQSSWYPVGSHVLLDLVNLDLVTVENAGRQRRGRLRLAKAVGKVLWRAGARGCDDRYADRRRYRLNQLQIKALQRKIV